MNATVASKQGAVIGGWVCLLLGSALMYFSLFAFLLYLPLFVAAFVLGIVAIAQRRIGNGIPILLLSVVIPLVFGVLLGTVRTAKVLADANDRATQRQAAAPADGGKPAQTEAAAAPIAQAGPTPEEAYIRDSIDLYEVESRYYETYSGKVPGVEFKLKNKGDRTLNWVEVTVYFKDASGAVIAEENFTPVIVVEGAFSMSDKKPLKPGYIWAQERNQFYQAKSVPTEWKEGAIEARITRLEFAPAEPKP